MEYENVLEQQEYMADYYLSMEFNSVALEMFIHVTLNRYIRFGYFDNKTLDSYIRLYIAAFKREDEELPELLSAYAEELGNIFGEYNG